MSMMVSLFFDSGMIKESCYGCVVFSQIFMGNELINNSKRVTISSGDILGNAYQDLTPYIINDNNCTIDFSNKINYIDLKDHPFVVVLEDVDPLTVRKLDLRLKKEMVDRYKGLSVIEIDSKDLRKQYWKILNRNLSLEYNKVIVFDLKENGTFYSEIFDEFGYDYSYDEIESDEIGDLEHYRKSSFVKTYEQLEIINKQPDLSRSYYDLNFSLVQEVNIAGNFIWKSFEELAKMSTLQIEVGIDTIDSLFSMIYLLSQGVERLQKIIIQMYIYKEKIHENKKLSELLYSHKLIAMNQWIVGEKFINSKLDKDTNELARLLDEFYNKARYNRYKVDNNKELELKMLRDFFKPKKNARFREYRRVIQWLEDAGMINICFGLNSLSLPLKGNYKESDYKIYMKDTGLLIAELDEESQDDLRANKNLGVYKGALYENLVAEAFVKSGLELYYYRNNNTTLEQDFLLRSKNNIVPVEVKYGRGKAKTMNELITDEKYSEIEYGIKLSKNNIGYNNQVYTFPHFLSFLIKDFLKLRKVGD